MLLDIKLQRVHAADVLVELWLHVAFNLQRVL
jgi:hypothetical protein